MTTYSENYPFRIQVPPITNYTMQGRTYRYYDGVPLYPFGYGQSYTSFKYTGLSVSPRVLKAGLAVKASIDVQNIGPYNADEVRNSAACSSLTRTLLHIMADWYINHYFNMSKANILIM